MTQLALQIIGEKEEYPRNFARKSDGLVGILFLKFSHATYTNINSTWTEDLNVKSKIGVRQERIF